MRLRYLAAAPLVAVAMFGTTAAAWPSGTAAVPQAPPALTVSALSDGYTAEARAIKTAERAAIRHRDSQLASALARLASRQVLVFNPNGQGVAAIGIRDLARAPGRGRGGARATGARPRSGGAAGGHRLARLPRPGHAQPGRDDLG